MKGAYREYVFKSPEAPCTTAYLMPHLRRLIGQPRGSVLDLGCGNGAIARQLLREGLDVYGVDASESGIAVANAEIPGRFHVLDFTAESLPPPLDGMTFEVMISTEVIEHLYDPRALLAFAHRHLATENGALILSTPYHGYLKNLALAVTGKLDAHFTATWTGGHIKFFSRGTLQRLLDEQSFKMTHFIGIGRLPWLWKSMLVRAQPLRVNS